MPDIELTQEVYAVRVVAPRFWIFPICPACEKDFHDMPTACTCGKKKGCICSGMVAVQTSRDGLCWAQNHYHTSCAPRVGDVLPIAPREVAA